ncbi:hypothetical protein Tco_0494976 [Tanacetum coccineum]
MVAYLEKSEGSEGFHQIIDFLTGSHIKNALTECPTLYASLIEQFWQTAALSTNEDGVRGITATIDRMVKVFVSDASIRRHLKLEDSEGLYKLLPYVEIFEQTGSSWGCNHSAAPMPHESPFQSVHSLGRDEGSLSLNELTDLCTLLSMKRRTSRKPSTRRAKVVISNDEEAEEDPSNQGRSLIEELDLDAGISLVPPHAADQGRIDDTQISDQPEEQLGVFSEATALADAARRRQSVEMSKFTQKKAEKFVLLILVLWCKQWDKGKAIMHESEPPKKIKKRVQAQISVDEELARVEEREEVTTKVHDIDWSDPAVLRYHTLQNRPFFVAEVRKNMCLLLTMGFEFETEVMKRSGFEEKIVFQKMQSLDVEAIENKVSNVDGETQHSSKMGNSISDQMSRKQDQEVMTYCLGENLKDNAWKQ